MAIQIDMRQAVTLIAGAVDLVGIDDVLHGRRVAIIAVECAKILGWNDEDLNLLFDAGLIHDLGVSSTRVHCTLVNELDWEGADFHCERGSQLLNNFTPLAHLAPLIRYHHTHWEHLQLASLTPKQALLANLVYLADRVDAQAAPFYSDESLLLHTETICSLIKTHRGTFFAPELVDAFLTAARAEAFWLVLNHDFIPQYVTDMSLTGTKVMMDLAGLKQFALVIANIVDAKSHFTNEHSLGVARLARFLAACSGISGDRLDLVEIAALLHDIGKLQVPDEVLESPEKLTTSERAIMKKHSFATYQILKRVSGLEELAHWASLHHESLDGGGYPFHLSAGELPLEARIIKVADIYQALAQNRPYRKPLPPDDILSHLRRLQQDLEVDPLIIDVVAGNIADCHQAAVGSAGVS